MANRRRRGIQLYRTYHRRPNNMIADQSPGMEAAETFDLSTPAATLQALEAARNGQAAAMQALIAKFDAFMLAHP